MAHLSVFVVSLKSSLGWLGRSSWHVPENLFDGIGQLVRFIRRRLFTREADSKKTQLVKNEQPRRSAFLPPVCWCKHLKRHRWKRRRVCRAWKIKISDSQKQIRLTPISKRLHRQQMRCRPTWDRYRAVTQTDHGPSFSLDTPSPAASCLEINTKHHSSSYIVIGQWNWPAGRPTVTSVVKGGQQQVGLSARQW